MRREVAEVRRWLSNYEELKEAIEAICELNDGDGLIAEEVSDLENQIITDYEVYANSELLLAAIETHQGRELTRRCRSKFVSPAPG